MITRETIIREVRNLAARFSNRAVSKELILRETAITQHQVLKHFESFRELYELAGLPQDRRHYRLTEQEIFSAMKEAFLQLGGITTQHKFARLFRYSTKVFKSRGLSWNSALAEFRSWCEKNDPNFPFLDDLPSAAVSKRKLAGHAKPAPSEVLRVTSKDLIETIKAYCYNCGGERRAYVRANHERSDSDHIVDFSITFTIAECCGCQSIFVQRRDWCSEWEGMEYHPVTGQIMRTSGAEYTYWPPPTTREKPNWIDQLRDDTLRSVADEAYIALNAGLSVLSAIGMRTLLDRAMLLCVGDIGGFAQKLKKMVDEGYIGADEKAILEKTTDAGSAAAHRGYAPDPQSLSTIAETVENFLHKTFILPDAVKELSAKTPSRSGT